MSKRDIVWRRWLKLCVKYYEKYLKWPAQDVIFKGKTVGIWCQKQRRNKRLGKYITIDRIARLDEVGFYWNPGNDKWNIWLGLLREYYTQFNDWPFSKTEYCGKKLGKWCITQRQHKRLGKYITPERIARLDEIGFPWEAKRGRRVRHV